MDAAIGGGGGQAGAAFKALLEQQQDCKRGEQRGRIDRRLTVERRVAVNCEVDLRGDDIEMDGKEEDAGHGEAAERDNEDE